MDPERKEIYETPETEFKMMLGRKSNMMRENADRHLEEMRKSMSETSKKHTERQKSLRGTKQKFYSLLESTFH